MPRFARFALLSLLFGAFSGTGCGPGGTNGTGVNGDSDSTGQDDGKGGNSGRGGNGGIGGTIIFDNCGNSKIDAMEQCDDGNKGNGDGCSSSCQKEGNVDCPVPGQPCNATAPVCGDGVIARVEACDEGMNPPSGGCMNCMAVAPGWQCRVGGRPCVPLCGDSILTGTENCDPPNAAMGCSTTCLTLPGWSCAGSPSVCVQSVCGNGMKEAGETCDLGMDNGLFYGDAMGCSKTCTQEPNCRPNGTTQACSTSCGDANIDAGEQCDDGNAVSGDGCSAMCMQELGFTCGPEMRPDTEPCPSNPALQCLVLPVIYRDFDAHNVASGHPDFFYLNAPASGGRTTGVTPGATKTTCVPNASGTKAPWAPGDACTNTDAVGPCAGLVAATLNAQGKPAFARGTCPCVFTDWDRTMILDGVTGAQDCWVQNEGSMRKRIEGQVSVIQSAQSFAQWYDPANRGLRGRIELAQMGMQYQFSSSTPGAMAGAVSRTVSEDIHGACLGTTPSLASGFFPLETAMGANAAKLCNIWPYWKYGAVTTREACRAGTGYPQISQWDPLGQWDMCPTACANPAMCSGSQVPRSDGVGTPVQGEMRNFYFTTEARYLFRYAGDATLSFHGDDDVWVFVNGKLALDLGAPHERLQGNVAITAAAFGLEMGRTYEIAVFHADRHPRESNYQLTLSAFATSRTSCQPRCGDAIRTGAEECDCGDGTVPAPADCGMKSNMDGLYGGCTAMCKYGPFCGDRNVDPQEQCDNGPENGAAYGAKGACTAACVLAPYCGDAITDLPFEECDKGEGMNGTAGSDCDALCKKIIL
jgi:fibro-slime domain-containing protein